MLTNRSAAAALVLISPFAAPVFSMQPEGEPVARVYDARELGAMLAPSEEADPLRRASRRQHGEPEVDPNAGEDPGLMAARGIFEKLTSSLNMTMDTLLQGVFMITGGQAEHARLIELIEAVRRVHADRFELDVRLWSVESSQAPALGSAASPPPGAMVFRLTTPRSAPTPIYALAHEWHLWGWQPVVGDNAVGNEPRFDAEPTGLWLTLTVGSDEGPGRVALRGRGAVLSSSVETLTPRIGELETTVQLPRSRERTVSIDAAVGAEPAVVMVMPGFEEGQTLVLAAGARPASARR